VLGRSRVSSSRAPRVPAGCRSGQPCLRYGLAAKRAQARGSTRRRGPSSPRTSGVAAPKDALRRPPRGSSGAPPGPRYMTLIGGCVGSDCVPGTSLAGEVEGYHRAAWPLRGGVGRPWRRIRRSREVAIQPFCEPVTDHGPARDRRVERHAAGALHRVHRDQLAPPLTTAAIGGMSLVTPVDVSLWVTKTSRSSGLSEGRSTSRVDRLSLGILSRTTFDPHRRWRCRPAITERADGGRKSRLLPGLSRLADGRLEASRPAEEEEDVVRVRRTSWMPPQTSASAPRTQGPMVDHGPRLGAHHALGEGGRTGYAKLLLRGLALLVGHGGRCP